MEYQVDNEMEISLRDLGYYLLKRWRILVFAVLVGALLLGGYRAGRMIVQLRDEEFRTQSRLTYEKSLKSYEEERKNLEYEMKTLEEKIKETEDYNQNSVLMRMNPYHVYLSTAELYVKTDYKIMPDKVYQAPDYTKSIMQYYALLLSKGQVIEDMAEQFSLEPVYITELIKIGTDLESRIISIKITHTDRQTCEDMTDYLIGCINSRQGEVMEQIGMHTISTMQKSTDEVVDEALMSYQKSQLYRMKELLASLKEKEQELEHLKEPELQSISMVTSFIRFLVFAVLLSLFAAVFLMSFHFIVSDRILSAEEFQRRFGVTCYLLPKSKAQKGFGSKFDNYIFQKEAGRSVMTADAVFSLLAADIKILLLGSIGEEWLSEHEADLEQLKNAPQVTVSCEKMWNKDTIKQLQQCDGVILVEKFQYSTYKSVKEEIEAIRNINKLVLGCVLLQ